MLRSLPVFVVLLAVGLLASAAFGTGWIGQRRVNAPNDSVSDCQPCLAVDSFGNPWVVWGARRRSADTSLFYARWQGDTWQPGRGVGPNAFGVPTRLRPSLAFDQFNVAWAVWNNGYADTVTNIGSSRYVGGAWGPEVLVNVFDSTDFDFAPRVACGGGQVWCVWYGGPTDMSPYSVFASRWYDSAGFWYPEMQVSPPDSTYHWWCDLAVDANGTPHVVWCNSDRRLICYSYYDGDAWVAPIAVNDTAAVGATSWADPHVATDNAGILQVCYTGVAQGATGRDIFYSRNDGTGWTPSVRVTSDTAHNYNEWYSDIAADRPDNVWVAWDRQGEGSDGFRVYAAHYDGSEWSSEERLDNDTAYYDGGAAVCLDGNGCPWVVWDGITYGAYEDVFYNRYLPSGSLEHEPHIARPEALRLAVTSPARNQARFSFLTTQTCQVSLEVYDISGRRIGHVVDGVLPAGQHSATWEARLTDGGRVPAGAYFGCLEAAGFSEKCKFTLLSD